MQGFWIQISNGPRIRDSNFKMARFWIQILNWTRFWIQNVSYFWDLNFKPLFGDSFFKHAGILDSNLNLMGFKIRSCLYICVSWHDLSVLQESTINHLYHLWCGFSRMKFFFFSATFQTEFFGAKLTEPLITIKLKSPWSINSWTPI